MRSSGFFRAFAIAGMLCLGAVSAQASVVNLSTGLDATDTLITLGNTPDAHWTVDQPFDGIAPAKVVDATNAGGAFFAWAANGPNSSWITIDPDSVGNGSDIPFTYYRTFSLTASEVGNVEISGKWGIDDIGELKLNGTTISTSLGNYTVTEMFSVLAGSGLFVAGPNTLTITMTSSDNFLEAVRLEGTLYSVPEPASLVAWSLIGLVGGLVTLRKRT